MSRGLAALHEQVIAADGCALCGACVALCPYLTGFEGRVIQLHDCAAEEGRCFRYCPRAELDPVALLRERLGAFDPERELELGPCLSAMRARAADPELRARGQSGGVVSALILAGLDGGLVDAAVLTRRPDGIGARGVLARTREEVLACAGSGYAAGPTLAALNAAAGDGPLGLVALPCQAQALARMRAATAPLESAAASRVRLVVGLFCTWAFDERRFAELLAARVGGVPTRLEITPPPERLLRVERDGRVLSLPVEEVEHCVRPACRTCLDMTAELADLSVGTVEGLAGWSTVLVRSPAGQELLERTRPALEIEALPDGYLERLALASRQKKRRALERDPGYLRLAPELRRALLRPIEVPP